MAMIETSRITNALFHRRPEQGYSFLERILTAAAARCSYPGCNRMRHVGPCTKEEAHTVEHDEAPISRLGAAGSTKHYA
ncbi:MAG: hypothetical protein JWP97_5653 [Labilithrix sp.]|nr:hypothetical protein [Labilithrix sp.]